jgi:hypothetical protein
MDRLFYGCGNKGTALIGDSRTVRFRDFWCSEDEQGRLDKQVK